MRICFIYRKFQILSRNSDSDFIWPLLKELSNHGLDVLMIAQKSRTGRDFIEREGVKVHFINQDIANPTLNEFEEELKKRIKIFNEEKPVQIIHSFDSSIHGLSKIKKALNLKIVLDVDALKMSQIFSILSFNQETAWSHIQVGIKAALHFIKTYFIKDRDLLNLADGVFVNSPQQKFFLERYYMYPDSRIFGVPRAYILPEQETTQVTWDLYKKNFKFSEDSEFILNITDMNQPHESLQILKSFEQLARKKSNCYLIIIGSGPYFKDIEYQLYNLALGNRAFLLGSLSPEEISQWISKAHLFVDLSSFYRESEGYTIEAMLRKKIIVASELGPLAHIIEDKVEGFLVRPSDSEGLFSIMNQVLNKQFDLNEISEKVFEKGEKVFAPGKAVDIVKNSYNLIINRKGFR